MTSTVWIYLAIHTLVVLVGGYFVLRWAWRDGYQEGVADMQLSLQDSLHQALRKEVRDGP